MVQQLPIAPRSYSAMHLARASVQRACSERLFRAEGFGPCPALTATLQ